MDIQRLSLLNINSNKSLDRAKSARKPTAFGGKTEQSARTEEGQQMPGKVLISVSSAVANSNGIDLADSHLSFAVDDDTGKTVINIVDSESGEVIRQIPQDGLLKLRKQMGEIQGLLLNQRV